MKLQTSLLLSMLAANTAIAQSEPPKWEGDIEFGYYQTDGNSNETSVLAKGQANRKDGLWTNQIKGNKLPISFCSSYCQLIPCMI